MVNASAWRRRRRRRDGDNYGEELAWSEAKTIDGARSPASWLARPRSVWWWRRAVRRRPSTLLTFARRRRTRSLIRRKCVDAHAAHAAAAVHRELERKRYNNCELYIKGTSRITRMQKPSVFCDIAQIYACPVYTHSTTCQSFHASISMILHRFLRRICKLISFTYNSLIIVLYIQAARVEVVFSKRFVYPN